jgi:hypothetical protein
MFTHSKCKFCRGDLPKPATPRNAFCCRLCKSMYRVHGTINTFRGDSEAVQNAVDSMGDRATDRITTVDQRDTNALATFKGTRQQPTLFEWIGESLPITNRGGRPKKSTKKHKAVAP